MASQTASCMSLRLLVNKKSQKILYAEAGKDFVDLLFSFFTLPTASVIKLLSALEKEKRIGCLTNLYDSVDMLPTMFMIAEKSDLLEPKVTPTLSTNILRIQPAPTVYYVCGAKPKVTPTLSTNILRIQRDPRDYYVCGAEPPVQRRYQSFQSSYISDTHYVTSQSGGRCACGNTMIYEVQLQNPSMGGRTDGAGVGGSGSGGGGYVKETVTFIITDDLQISPSSTITSLNLLNKLNVKELSDLAERNASVGPNEGTGAAMGFSGFHDSFERRFW